MSLRQFSVLLFIFSLSAFGWLYDNHPRTAISNLHLLVEPVCVPDKKGKLPKATAPGKIFSIYFALPPRISSATLVNPQNSFTSLVSQDSLMSIHVANLTPRSEPLLHASNGPSSKANNGKRLRNRLVTKSFT